MRVSIVFGGLVGKHGGKVISQSLAFTSEARLCCDNYTNLKLCSI